MPFIILTFPTGPHIVDSSDRQWQVWAKKGGGGGVAGGGVGALKTSRPFRGFWLSALRFSAFDSKLEGEGGGASRPSWFTIDRDVSWTDCQFLKGKIFSQAS